MNWTQVSTDCENPRPGKYLVNRRERRFLHLGCDRWRCRGCGRRKAKRVQKRMLLIEPTHMLTFSLPRAAGVEELGELHAKRRAFFRWLQRQAWGMTKQGWIRETGELHGQLHLHCLVRMRGSYLPFAEIQRAAARIGLGVVDFQRIWRRETAARYVAKYMTKALGGAAIQPGPSHSPREPRRFGMSNYLTLPPNIEWTLAQREDGLHLEPRAPLVFVIGNLESPSYLRPS